MVILEQLRIHVGGLVHLKSELWWYGGRGWDGITGRVCLLLNAAPAADVSPPVRPGATAAGVATGAAEASAIALLLLDGCPCWVWVGPDDLELL